MIPTVFTSADPLSPTLVIFAIIGSFLLSLIIAFVYIRTHRGLSYSQAFVIALVLLGTMGAVVMMIATGSLLRAIGIFGAFSIIRFRTPIKDPKDMAFLMMVMGIGMAMGAQMYVLAIFATTSLICIVWFLSWTNFGSTRRHDYLVRLITANAEAQEACELLLRQNVHSMVMLSGHASKDAHHVEFSYGVQPKKDMPRAALLTLISACSGTISVDIFDAKHEVEF